jgi:hypothetical protein
MVLESFPAVMRERKEVLIYLGLIFPKRSILKDQKVIHVESKFLRDWVCNRIHECNFRASLVCPEERSSLRFLQVWIYWWCQNTTLSSATMQTVSFTDVFNQSTLPLSYRHVPYFS